VVTHTNAVVFRKALRLRLEVFEGPEYYDTLQRFLWMMQSSEIIANRLNRLQRLLARVGRATAVLWALGQVRAAAGAAAWLSGDSSLADPQRWATDRAQRGAGGTSPQAGVLATAAHPTPCRRRSAAVRAGRASGWALASCLGPAAL
jgi:hypothetical protein